MGRAKILENLGEGHYRIGLDLDLTYARRQLAEAQAYLAAFASRYQDAQDAVTAARAALVTVNDDLSSYLSAAQAACEAAYQAERAAYEDYLDAVNSQPAPGVAAGLLATAEAAHEAFMGAFTDELAIAATAADADYQAGVGLFLDEPAVLNAEAVKLSGMSALLLARDEFAAGHISLAEYEYAQNAYDTLRGDWLSVIADNSGDPLVKHYQRIWDAKRAAFDKARADLGKLLGSGGGIPAELEALLKKQAETYAALRAAEKDLQSLTLIKAEKERFVLELTQRLAPYTDEAGDPVLTPVNAWCVDYTDDMPVDTTVGTIEIPGERYLGVRVRPGYESRETWSAEREGLLSPSWSMSPETTWFNWALHPGNARWSPNARLGVIQAIDSNAETCTVVLDPQSNSPATVAPEGAVMELNKPIKYVIDENGVEQAVLPGPNVTVVEGVTILANVPIEYMECNSGAFVVGDHVMVQFTGQAWTAPKVVGFAEAPRPCSLPGVAMTGQLPSGAVDPLLLRDDPPGLLRHPFGTIQGANLDWTSTDRKHVVTFAGPPGRSLAFGVFTGEGVLYDTYPEVWRMRFGPETPIYSNDPIFSRVRYFMPTLYFNHGRQVVTAPAGYFVLGGAVTQHTVTDNQGREVVYRYLLAVFCGNLQAYDLVTNPAAVDHVFAYARLTGTTAGPWQIIRTETLSDDDRIMPPINAVFFSGSGRHSATCIPIMTEGTDFNGVPNYAVGNDVILRATWTPSAEGVTVTTSKQYQGDPEGQATYHKSIGGFGFGPWTYSESSSSSSFSEGIIAVDYVGETEVTLSVTATHDYESHLGGGGTSVEAGPGDIGSISSSAAISESWAILDDYRGLTIGSYQRTDSASGSQDWETAAGGDSYISSSTAANNSFIQRPYFYDLRSGAMVRHVADSVSSRHSSLSHWDSPGGYIMESVDLNCRLESKLVQFDATTVSESSNTPYVPGSEPAAPPFYGAEIEPVSESNSAAIATESAANWARPVYFQRYDGGRLVYCAPVIHTQPCNPLGDVVVRADFEAFPMVSQTASESMIDAPSPNARLHHYNAAFCTAYSLDAAWAAHLATDHPPADDEPPPEQTALQANLTPMFRV